MWKSRKYKQCIIDHLLLKTHLTSEINFLQLHHSRISAEDRVVEDIHDGFSGPVEVGENLVLTHHLIPLERGFLLGLSLQPTQEFLVFLKGLKGIEDVCFLTKKAVDQIVACLEIFPLHLASTNNFNDYISKQFKHQINIPLATPNISPVKNYIENHRTNMCSILSKCKCLRYQTFAAFWPPGQSKIKAPQFQSKKAAKQQEGLPNNKNVIDSYFYIVKNTIYGQKF